MSARPVREGLFVTDSISGEVFLVGSECRECGGLAFPASDHCPYCGSSSAGVTRLPRRGVVELCTWVHRPSAGYTGPLPYGLGVIRLSDDLKVIAPIQSAAILPPGTPVECAIWEVGTSEDGSALVSYCFRPCALGEGEPRPRKDG
jgi:uncharacterized OB-fold protein